MRSTLNHHFATMAYNNAWANHRLLTACNKLSQVDFEAKRTSFFPSLKATLNHIVTVDWYYIDALERALRHQEPNHEPDRFFEPEEPFVPASIRRDRFYEKFSEIRLARRYRRAIRFIRCKRAESRTI